MTGKPWPATIDEAVGMVSAALSDKVDTFGTNHTLRFCQPLAKSIISGVARGCVSGRFQEGYRLLRLMKRVYCHVGDEPRANRGRGKSPKVDSIVGKLLRQHGENARQVRANDSNRVEGLGDVETRLCSGGDFVVAL